MGIWDTFSSEMGEDGNSVEELIYVGVGRVTWKNFSCCKSSNSE